MLARLCTSVFLIGQLILSAPFISAKAQSISDAPEIEVAKLALVIGNRDYRGFPSVPTAINDAQTIANRLKSLSFDVIVRPNATYTDILDEIRELRKRVDQAKTAYVRPLVVLYFSGHGFVVSGRQFVAGINVDGPRRDDALRASAAVQTFIDELADSAVLVSFFDACRSDLRISDSAGQRASPTTQRSETDRGIGLGSLRTADRTMQHEYLVAYANRLGEPVVGFLNRGDPTSPYTKLLDTHLGDGRDIMAELHLVRDEVQRTVPNHDPGIDDHMNGRVFFGFTPGVIGRMRAEWAEATNSASERGMRQFLSDYENGPLAYRASEWLQSLGR